MINKNHIKKIGFTSDSIYIETQDEIKKSLSLKYFPRLQGATSKQRENYRLSPLGIHWEELNEDLSFEGFFSFEPIENEIAKFFKTFPEINMSQFARRIGISSVMLRHYTCGTKNPSAKRRKLIQKAIHQIGTELSAFHLSSS